MNILLILAIIRPKADREVGELQGLIWKVQLPFTSLKALQSKSATTVFIPAL